MREPLSPLTMAILLSLSESDKHGYALMQEVGAVTGSMPGTGSLYAALERLSAEGLAEESPTRPRATEDARRRYFRITRQGRARARDEARRMQEVVNVARVRGLLTDAGQ